MYFSEQETYSVCPRCGPHYFPWFCPLCLINIGPWNSLFIYTKSSLLWGLCLAEPLIFAQMHETPFILASLEASIEVSVLSGKSSFFPPYFSSLSPFHFWKKERWIVGKSKINEWLKKKRKHCIKAFVPSNCTSKTVEL